MAARVLSRHVTVTDPEPRVDYTRVLVDSSAGPGPGLLGLIGLLLGYAVVVPACYTPSLASVGSLSVPTGKGSAPITREQPGITPSEAHSHTCSSSQPDRRGACARPLP
ncbi:hypothetical protein JCM18918_665 [Cutibacterium acnes JCM 18918]|nr:hypothetical protein JCM18918_665 [Cutibacterium acnes JCM 18918]